MERTQIELKPGKSPKYEPFTHFVNFPITDIVPKLEELQNRILESVDAGTRALLQARPPAKLHITVCQLALGAPDALQKAVKAISECEDGVKALLGAEGVQVDIEKLDYFVQNPKANTPAVRENRRTDLTFIYLKVRDNDAVLQACDMLIKKFVSQGLIPAYEGEFKKQHLVYQGTIRPQHLHISLFRVVMDKNASPDYTPIYQGFAQAGAGEKCVLKSIHLSDIHQVNEQGGYQVLYEITADEK